MAGTLLVAMIAGSAVVWIGFPIGGMWLAGQLTESFGTHMPLAMAIILPAVVAGTLGLAWLNSAYLAATRSREQVPEHLWRRQRSGPLELILAVCFVIGLAALFVWFFLFAENPPRGVF